MLTQIGSTGSLRLTAALLLALIAAALMGHVKAWGAEEFRPLEAAHAVTKKSDPIAGQKITAVQLAQTTQSEPASQAATVFACSTSEASRALIMGSQPAARLTSSAKK